ncbi:type III-B CRISPR module RAMP protein Cmr4 [Truepera radiovictrix]|nr:type III-B CRISPR module RAMP protein Cmr4 [Truepera radiovictrix]WMT56665.1 type III-B CRISPR module RAMP protein Cmr4 [Truepera radiovictrix]
MNATLLIWQALTPVHSGTGQASAGVIDLPIARETATGFPIVPASSIKGVLRDGRTDEETNQRYGSLDAAAKLTFTDARLLCLPVRSYRGTFAFVTCPLIINRLRRDAGALGLGLELPDLPETLDKAHVTGNTLQHGGKVLFEDIDLSAFECPNAKALANALAQYAGLGESFKSRLAVVPNDIFTFFSETATEVAAHIALESETKTVKGGALWYEEALPAESLLSSFVLKELDKNGKPVNFDAKKRSPLQIGGKGSVGKGLLRVVEASGG